MDDLDSTELDLLEATLDEAERSLEEADLQAKYQELLLVFTRQKHLLISYTNELYDMQAAVDNINEINTKIPRICYNKPQLEPTLPPL